MAVLFKEDLESYIERFGLVRERIFEIRDENILPAKFGEYFNETGEYLCGAIDIFSEFDVTKPAPVNACIDAAGLMRPIMDESYENSFLNPQYAVKNLGESLGGVLSFVYSELTGIIPAFCEGDIEHVTLYLELFVQIQTFLESEYVDSDYDEGIFELEYVRKEVDSLIHSFYFDNNEIFAEKSVIDMVVSGKNHVYDILMNSDLNNTDYLYRYGLPISDNELKLSEYVAKLSDEEIDRMAAVYVNGFVTGFKATGKDMSIKDSVKLEYPIGFERVVKSAVKQFEKVNLSPVLNLDTTTSYLGQINRKRGAYVSGYYPQFVFDHKNDKGYYFSKEFYKRRLECLKVSFEKYKKAAKVYGGPAVIEVFGEPDFNPVEKKENYTFTDKQNKWNVEFASKSGELVNEYIPGDEYSYTIIAFPLPSIAQDESRYQQIFDETMRINTLDYDLYQKMQQRIIDVLDMGECVHVTGNSDAANKTDITVKLHKLDEPAKQTNFENCVADVNIPVGEVFTSPVLTGTNGLLHVNHVYLGDLAYKDLRIEVKDGMVVDYSCGNFEDAAEGRKLIYENILYRHESLPMGEFAIGTNTVAYTMARKFGIESKLPILIAEKTGPHFAFGDTCYSHSEDVPMINPDGKECIARENECSMLRNEDPMKAYFNCHTDITIPYDELDIVEVVMSDGSTERIIEGGRFVLEGLEELNKPLDN